MTYYGKKEQVLLQDGPRKPTNKRLGRRPADLPSGREALLKAALRLFSQRGFEGVSLRVLAKEADVDVALVARLFLSKAGLWLAMLENLEAIRVAKFDARLKALNDGTRPLRQRLIEMIDLFIAMANDVPDVLRLILQDVADDGERIANAVVTLIVPVKNEMVRLIAEGMKAGVVRGSDPEIMFLIITGAIAVPFGASALVDVALARATNRLPERLRDTILIMLMPASD